MEKEFIPYEQALALKELGFDEPCFGCYFHNNKDVVEYNPDGIPLNHNNRNSRISAPLYQQAFRWLLKKINKDVLFDSNKYSIRFDDVYYSVLLGGVAMFVFVTKENVINELLILIKEKGEK
jgi:hypothetical protein